MLTLAFLALAGFGALYIVFAIFAGHGADHAGEAGAAGHDAGGPAEAYGIEGGGHGAVHAHGDAGASFHFPFFSPLALATLFASLGAWGLILLHGFHLSEALSVGIAVPAALATSWTVTYVGWRVMASSRGTSMVRSGDLLGASGEVTTPIPAGGLGEVAVFVSGQRFASAARADDGGAIPRGTGITVRQVLGSTLVVAASRPGGQ